jgi:hypothetical protein
MNDHDECQSGDLFDDKLFLAVAAENYYSHGLFMSNLIRTIAVVDREEKTLEDGNEHSQIYSISKR